MKKRKKGGAPGGLPPEERAAVISASGMAALFLAAGMAAGCPLYIGEDYRMPVRGAAGEALVVVDYNLRSYVPIPVAGEAPVTKVTSRKDMDITAAWQDAAGADLSESLTAFAEGAVYRAAITLEAKNGYAFDRAVPFAYSGGVVAGFEPGENEDPQKRSVLAVYHPAGSPSPVTKTDLADLLPAPAGGGIPAVNFSTNEYVGRVLSWEQRSGELWAAMDGAVFKSAAEYRALVSLEAMAGFTFTGSPAFTHAGTAALETEENSGGMLRLRAEFGETPPAYVSSYSLGDYVPPPVAGQYPVRALALPQVTVTASWWEQKPENAGEEGWAPFPSGVFKAEGQYRAVISLAAGAGYMFDDKPETVFKYEDHDVATQGEDRENPYRRTVRVTYTPFMRRVGADNFAEAWTAIAGAHGAEALYVKLENTVPHSVTGGAVLFTPVYSPRNLIIEGGGADLQLTGGGSLFTVGEEVTVTLRNMTLKGTDSNDSALVTVNGGTLVLENVSITSNKEGRGISAAGGSATLGAKSSVTGNAGGVSVTGGSFTMEDGAEISGNTHSGILGGGVYVTGGSFVMNGGKILTNSGAILGGGIYIGGGSCLLRGGEIKGNTAGDGPGVYLDNESSGQLSMYGGAAVDTGNAVRLKGNKPIYIGSALTAAGNDGIVANIIPEGTPKSGVMLLVGQTAGNHTKFTVGGQSGRIDANGKYIAPNP